MILLYLALIVFFNFADEFRKLISILIDVSISNPSTESITVLVDIGGGTATGGGVDYKAPTTRAVTFAPGDTTATINVPIIDDDIFESGSGPEDFNVTITSVIAGTATIGSSNTVNTKIYDDGTTDGTTPVDPNNPSLGDDNLAPQAKPDTETLTEDSGSYTESGNVLTNDDLGNVPTQNFTWGSETASYGSITKNVDGTYSYTLNNNDAAVQALGLKSDGTSETLTETFTYSFIDQDGETANSTLTITINGTNDTPVITNGASANGTIATAAEIIERTDNSTITRSGVINFIDIDASDEPTVSAVGWEANEFIYDDNNGVFIGTDPTNSLTDAQKKALSGIFTATNDAGSFEQGTWNINATSTALDFLPEGETITIRYAVQVNDGNNITTSNAANGNEISTSEIRYVEVTITGTNDGIALVNDSASKPEDTTLTGNIFRNDSDDPDSGQALTVENYEVSGIVGTIAAGVTTTLTPDGTNSIGDITLNSDGSYTFVPATNYSGSVPVITANVTNGLAPSDPSYSAGSETLTITVNPVSDAPGLITKNTISTNEDTTVALGSQACAAQNLTGGLSAPTITDNTDLDTSSTSNDTPERIGLVSLTGFRAGTVLDYGGTNPITITSNSQTVRIKLSDVDTVNNPPEQNSSTITMTKAQFESMTLTPPRDDATNMNVRMSVTEYEVNSGGTILSGVAGKSANTTVTVDVKAVTDTSGNNQSGDDFSEFGYKSGESNVDYTNDTLTTTVAEGDTVILPITTSFGDLVYSSNADRENYGFVITGLAEGTVVIFEYVDDNGDTQTIESDPASSNGQALIGMDTA